MQFLFLSTCSILIHATTHQLTIIHADISNISFNGIFKSYEVQLYVYRTITKKHACTVTLCTIIIFEILFLMVHK